MGEDQGVVNTNRIRETNQKREAILAPYPGLRKHIEHYTTQKAQFLYNLLFCFLTSSVSKCAGSGFRDPNGPKDPKRPRPKACPSLGKSLNVRWAKAQGSVRPPISE